MIFINSTICNGLGRPKSEKTKNHSLRNCQELNFVKKNFLPFLTPKKIFFTDKLVISQDPEILGHDTAKYMFVDSKLGVHDRDRLMVTREPSGTLRHMTEEERERLNQIYFPKPGRRIKPPVLFEIENLEKV